MVLTHFLTMFHSRISKIIMSMPPVTYNCYYLKRDTLFKCNNRKRLLIPMNMTSMKEKAIKIEKKS